MNTTCVLYTTFTVPSLIVEGAVELSEVVVGKGWGRAVHHCYYIQSLIKLFWKIMRIKGKAKHTRKTYFLAIGQLRELDPYHLAGSGSGSRSTSGSVDPDPGSKK